LAERSSEASLKRLAARMQRTKFRNAGAEPKRDRQVPESRQRETNQPERHDKLMPVRHAYRRGEARKAGVPKRCQGCGRGKTTGKPVL
jgi:hypothetical protein